MKSSNGDHFREWPVCTVPVVTDACFFPSVMHTVLHSIHSPSHHGLVSSSPKVRFGHLIGSAVLSISQHISS